MDFGEFIAAFGSGYSKLIDCKTNKGLNKQLFCRYLLCSITNKENLVLYKNGIEDKKHELSEAAYQSFYRNGDRRSLHPIAESIINSNSLDTSKFMSFLKEYCKDYSKEKLLTNFKRYLPSASSSTLFDDITDELVKILKREAAISDKRRKEPKSANKADFANESDDSLETQMDRLLEELISTGREIAEFEPTGVCDDVRSSKLRETLKNDFKQWLALSKQLPQNKNGESSSIYSDIRASVQSLTAENFILSTDQFMIESVQNYHIHRLCELLRKAKEKY